MAAYIGKDGKVNIGTATVAYIDSWSLNPGIGTAEVTSFGDNSKGFRSTVREWAGSFTGTMDRSDTDQADLMDQFEDGTLADIALRLHVAAATYWSGNVRLTGQTVNSAVADKVSITWEFQGNGDLSYTAT